MKIISDTEYSHALTWVLAIPPATPTALQRSCISTNISAFSYPRPPDRVATVKIYSRSINESFLGDGKWRQKSFLGYVLTGLASGRMSGHRE